MSTLAAFDVIGDVHGQDQKLEALLISLGYVANGKGYRAPQGRQALFLGDLIDRGPGQMRVLEIARAMVDDGQARCIMGNHEFNAIAYVTPDPNATGECYRPNRIDGPKSAKNRKQHAEFLTQVGEGTANHRSWIEWFQTLPVCLDLGGLRAVHGCWDDEAVQSLWSAGWRLGSMLDNVLLREVHRVDEFGRESTLMKARKLLTCGLEIPLPPGVTFRHKGASCFRHIGASCKRSN